ncbi:MAG TPA: hypothetical protein VMH88_06565 [Gemmatimonadales bacterium]|nr:hypothetical protein [Gemmatimonadales bacterium]
MRAATLPLCIGLLVPVTLAAQDPRLERRLDAGTRAAVVAVIDSARAAGLPIEPLVDRALEGAAKHADSARIVAAVSLLATELATARAALGPSSSPPELDAGASALRAGVRPSDLTQLRQRRPQSLTVALAALTDLVVSGVPADSAAAAVLALASSARDDQIVDFRRAVERDIALGAPPAAAATVRVNAAVRAAGRSGKP